MKQLRLIHSVLVLVFFYSLELYAAAADAELSSSVSPAQTTAEQANKTCYQKDSEEKYKSCSTALDRANQLCHDSNPNVKNTMAAIGGMLSTMSGLAQNAQCSTWGDILDMGNKAITAFNATCGGAKAAADMSCNSAKTQAEQEYQSCTQKTPSQDCSKEKQAVETGQCYVNRVGSYSQQLAAGSAGLVQIMATASQHKDCDKDTSFASGQGVNCADAKNINHAMCICQANPRAVGCSGNLTGEGTSVSPIAMKDPKSTDNSGIDPDFSGFDSNLHSTSGSDSNSKLPAAGGGGGGGARSLSGSGKDAENKSAGINTQVSSGDDGGGGGRRAGGSGYADISQYPNSPLRKGLPTLDPTGRGIASTQKQVTGGGGKTNWEKVRDRYRENMGTLLLK